MVELLIDFGGNVDARDKRERRPIHFAAFAGHWDVVRTLMLKGADPTAKDKEARLMSTTEFFSFLKIVGHTVYWWRTSRKDFLQICILCRFRRHSLTKSAQNRYLNIGFQDVTPLHCAAGSGQLPTVAYLLSAEVSRQWPTLNPLAVDLDGFTPLHYAANNGREKAADQLISSGGAVDAVSNLGFVSFVDRNLNFVGEIACETDLKYRAEVLLVVIRNYEYF